jgi:hypothetical protein
MSPRRHRRGPALAVVAALVAVVALSGGSSSSAAPAGTTHASGNSASFQDVQGDSVDGGPDLTSINISNDDSGVIHIQALVPNSTTQANGGGLGIFFDTNNDGKRDYFVWFEAGQGTGALYQISGDQVYDVSDPNFRSSYSGGVSVTLSRSAIGAGTATQIQFEVETLYNDINYYYDRAPDSGWYQYYLGAPAAPQSHLSIPLSTITSKPAPPQSGARFVVSFKAQRDGKALASGTVTCTATVGGGKSFSGKGAYANGTGTCALTVPHHAGGKALVVTITVNSPGATSDTVVTRDTIVGEPTLKIGQRTATPPSPQAGGDFYLSIGVLVLRTGAAKSRLQHGTVLCAATVGGVRLAVRRALVVTGLGVQCGWHVPASARGRQLTATVTVRSLGQATRKTYSFLVH